MFIPVIALLSLSLVAVRSEHGRWSDRMRRAPGNCSCMPMMDFSAQKKMKYLPFGFPPMPPTPAIDPFGVCDTNGRPYTDKCALINAQSMDPNLGGRPCNMTAVAQLYANISWPAATNDTGANMTGPMAPGQKMQMMMGKMAQMYKVCLTNGVTVMSPLDLLNQLQATPTLGVRCCGACPCTLECPSKKEMMMGDMKMIGMMMGKGHGDRWGRGHGGPGAWGRRGDSMDESDSEMDRDGDMDTTSTDASMTTTMASMSNGTATM